MAQEHSESSVNEAGQKGGEKVRELIEKGKQTEVGESGISADPVALIRGDHRAVESLFSQFEQSTDTAAEEIAGKICDLLEIHTSMEEKFFYPVVQREAARQGNELVQDGLAEHKAVKDLITRLRRLCSKDAEFAEVVVLVQENVAHHVEEEEQEMLPLAQECIEPRLLNEIGNQMAAYKEKAKGSMH